ncbi:TIGR01777 family oxidoreductase [Algibacillus agarilyticus]|uniref:TIGR01777 family oxidoreductase n=1 Tax=Algibacillus agarilyticus TaxID=2234133 RepID=UPI000DD0E8A9|nr:TIGR01777 family oxidoreductase [Algibacillus agarilyticus]
MKYLITGGTGLIGQALIKKLLRSNNSITVLTRDVNKAKIKFGNDVHFINALSLSNVENINVVINLAGEPIADKRWSAEHKKTICNSRWGITAELVELINQAKNPPSVFISGSAIGIYGRQNESEREVEIGEDFTHYNHEFTYDLCFKWEQIAQNIKQPNTRVVLLRTGVVLANNQGALAKMLPPFKLGLGGKMGTGKQIMSWIHVEDAINAILHIQNNNMIKGPVNITAPKAVSNAEFSHQLAHQLNRPCLLTTPAWVLKLIFGEMSDILLFGQNVKPNKLLQSKFNFSYPTISAALTNLI